MARNDIKYFFWGLKRKNNQVRYKLETYNRLKLLSKKSSMNSEHFTKDNFEEKVIKSTIPVMVDFWATWCGPCRMAGPVIDQLVKQYKDRLVVGKVNVDEEKELAQKYGVMSIPTVVFFKAGKEVERTVGFPGKEEYEEVIKKLL